MDQDRKEWALLKDFGPTLADNPSALRECLNLLQIYQLEPRALHSKWEAYIMNATSTTTDGDDGSMTAAHLEGFKSYLRRSLEQQVQQHQTSSSASFATPKKATVKSRYHGSVGASQRINHDMDLDPHQDVLYVEEKFILNLVIASSRPTIVGSPDKKTNFAMPTTPTRNRGSNNLAPLGRSPSQQSPSSKQFALRRNISETEETLNSHLMLRSDPPNVGSDYRNVITSVVPVKPYRYMFEKISEKGDALDDRIDAFAEIYKEAHPEVQFSNPEYQTQSIVNVIGRICSDANEGKSNERSLLLETSRALGSGSRVRLDTNEVSGVSFFPGQIVVLSGINANGSVFVVTRVHELPSLPMAGESPAVLEDLHYRRMSGQPIKMIAAAGPYTLNDNLLFEPFAALMEHVDRERPDVLLLMGPFVSSQHPAILSGNVDMSPERYFAEYISKPLAKHQDRYPKEMQILLVPSLQDVVHETVVMPQPAFEHPRALGLPAGTYRLSNPAQFTINEVAFAVNTTDILMHLSGDEIARNPERTDRMGRLSKYIIQQRNMHPVYPGLTSDIESGVDFNQYDLLDLKGCPDVVILPSKLKHFAKTVDKVITINPNQLSKAQAGGTFARLTIHPLSQTFLEDSVMLMDEKNEQSMRMYHKVYERCRVDLIRV
ncbi:DNA-directed DNA polymerase alpha subunit pol12 [Mortierella alpina]|nr:DNA-directed DNA polymerase alpha subunit pol12 [Mortierella alpina]